MLSSSIHAHQKKEIWVITCLNTFVRTVLISKYYVLPFAYTIVRPELCQNVPKVERRIIDWWLVEHWVGVYVCNFTLSVSCEHTFLPVSLMTLEIISWDSRISWRRLTNSRCLTERGTAFPEREVSDCTSVSGPSLRLGEVNGLCGIGGPGDDGCVVGVWCEIGCSRCRWVPV